MGSDAKKGYGAVGRGELLWFEPEFLVLVDDENHPLYDERVHFPVDEAMVRNIMVNGVIEPVLIRKNGESKGGTPIVEVVDGRQRVKNAREANKRLKAEGKESIRVPATLRRGENKDLYGVMVSANDIRKGDNLLVRAKKCAKLLKYGRTEEEAAILHGVSETTVRNWLALLEASVAVQKAVERAEIPLTVATKLAKLPMDEQPEALEKLRAEGATHGEKAQEAANGATGRIPRPRMLGRSTLTKLLGRFEKTKRGDLPPAIAVLKYVLGDKEALPKRWLSDAEE